MRPSGIIIGSFEPLHLGHIRHILYASGHVEALHIIIIPHSDANPDFCVTLQDKARWLQMACRDLPFIHIHTHDNVEMASYENNIADQSQFVDKLTQTLPSLLSLLMSLNIETKSDLFISHRLPIEIINPTDFTLHVLPSLSLNTSSLNNSKSAYGSHVLNDFDSIAIHQNPLAHWNAIHPEARADYTRTIAIVGGESSGKTTLVHKLANYYGSSLALEMGRLYVGTDLGGSEVGLQYSDYAPIALDHAEAVRVAKYRAPAPITIIDTDFVTTQAFCEVYEGRTHPFVASCIDEFRFDHTLFLANNTPWVDDGMRSLGTQDARSQFEHTLSTIFNRHSIKPHRIDTPDYFARYEQAIEYINKQVLSETF